MQTNDAYLEFKEDSELYKKYGKKYKVEKEVANIFLCDIGTGGYGEAIFLKLDGTASSVSGLELEEKSTIECELIPGIKNAVNVISYTYAFTEVADGEKIQFGEPVYMFIDINGNIIK